MALACSLLTACGTGDASRATGGAPPTAAHTSAAASRPVHDPPATFATKGARMPDGLLTDVLDLDNRLVGPTSVTLYGKTAYVGAFDHVQAIDTTNGHVTATIEPAAKALAEGNGTKHKAGAPAIVTIGGTPALLTPFPVQVSGTGTQASHQAVEIDASDPATAEVRWRVTLRLPEWADDLGTELTATAVGADGNTGVVAVSQSNDNAVTYGIDLTTHRQIWVQDGFAATGIAGGMAVGWDTEKYEAHAAGHDAATGAPRWQGQYIVNQSVSALGPHFVLLQGGHFGSEHPYVQLLDPATGKTKQQLPVPLSKGTCVYDEKSTVVCHGTGNGTDDDAAFGLDATTGKTLWRLPDKQADRIAPEITTAWHGRVYGKTKNGPVALDARTGQDLPTSPRIAPVLVNGSAGLAPDKVDGWKTELFVYPATD
ncbi:outer membrane protein assembly factor BamB family protein [Streptomyces sp. NBC_01465]|uniref:outer membrane protein assembly factor BamB family protein n=1 Tax=Streptomyces sp. NBC_01465 TaxID=2903878 RepID=UPI002E318F0D|nr:PQQ-binding-like beta-propeller repeat protein [Streptomyces sp. NBC_01465]